MLGNKVKVLRGELDLTRKELAKDLNISYQTLSKYETNEREPNIDTLKKLADYFNVSIDELVSRNSSDSTTNSTAIKAENEHSVPVYQKLYPNMETSSPEHIAWYEHILLRPEDREKHFFYYIAEDMSLQGLRIEQNDKLLFESASHIEEDCIALLQINRAVPCIRAVCFDAAHLIVMAAVPYAKPLVIAKKDAEKQVKFLGKLRRVEFIPALSGPSPF